MKRYPVAVFCLLVVLCASATWAQVLFEEDFEVYPLGAGVGTPHPWEEYEGVLGQVTDEVKAQGQKSLKLFPKAKEEPGNIHHEGGYLFTHLEPATGKLQVEFAAYLTETKRALVVELGQLQTDPERPGYNRGGVGAGAVSLYFHDNTIRGFSTTWEDTGFAYPVRQWIEVKLFIDVSQKNYEVQVRTPGAQWQSLGVIPFRRDVTALDYLHFVNYEPVTPRVAVAYIDNVRVTIP